MTLPETNQHAAGRGYLPLVEVRRGGRLESVHHGAVVVADARGRVVQAHGDPGEVTFLRSSAKPVQVLPLIASGAAERAGFSDAQIAVMIGSHGGEPMHVEAVRSILARIGVPEEALQCGAHPPFYRPAARALREAGVRPSAIHNNCSGKHAGMLTLAKALGAPLDSYLDPGHPVQTAIRDAMAALSGLPPGAIPIAVDGCSAPTFALPLSAAAGLYARLMDPESLSESLRMACRRVVGAMHAHPEMVAGTDRICTVLMREGACDLIAKIGAEGFYGLGFRRDGRGFGIALKVADGNAERARPSAVIECLRRLAILTDPAAEALAARFVGPLRNHRGTVVGEVVPILNLRPIE